MARLSNEQAQKLLKEPINQKGISQAKKQQNRLKFHTNTVDDANSINDAAYKDWLEFAHKLLPKDKHALFDSLITFPIKTNQILESVWTELAKVFESQNPTKKANFINKDIQADAMAYDDKIRLSSYMSDKVWDRLRTGINSFIVIDLPNQQRSERPEPYPYIVDIERVLAVNINDDFKVEYIAFTVGDNSRRIVIDDEYYRVYTKPTDLDDYQIEALLPHSTFGTNNEVLTGLGYCPVCSIWQYATEESSYINKSGPVTNVLGDLDWYLFKEVSSRYLSLYGDYPILANYEEECEEKNDQGHMCEGGKIQRDFEYTAADGSLLETKTVYEPCPACERRKLIGPGSVFSFEAPRNSKDVDLMANDPIRFIEVSNDKLIYNDEKLDNLRDDIFKSCVGYDGEPVNNQAKNEKQVASSFESRQSVLDELAQQLEICEKFIWDTVYILRYGRENYLGSFISFGTKFYLQTLEIITQRYQEAKNSGKPMYELKMLRDLANKTENRNNPDELYRNNLLSMLEPYPDLGISQVQSLGLQDSDKINYFVKLNFNSYIDRFERENIDIVEFGSKISLDAKIKIIKSKLEDYAKEQIASARPYNATNERSTGQADQR